MAMLKVVVLAAVMCAVALAACPDWLKDLTSAATFLVTNECTTAINGNTNGTISDCNSATCQTKCYKAIINAGSDSDYRSCASNAVSTLNGTLWADLSKPCRCGSAAGASVAVIAAAVASIFAMLS